MIGFTPHGWWGNPGTACPPVPTAPALSALTANDGKVTVGVVAADSADTVYVGYRLASAQAWTWNPALKSIGSGSVEVTGLSNGRVYVFILYSTKDGMYSKPGDVMPSGGSSATPTDGTPSTMPTYYRVISIQRVAGTGSKTLVVEKIEKPIEPVLS